MKKRVIVIGATGLIGQAVANQLQKDGNQVRVMTRNTEKARGIFNNNFEIIEADVLKKETLENAFKEMQCVYVNLPEQDIPEAMKNIIEIAKKEGIEHIAHTSGCTVRKENAWHPMIKAHFDGEQQIKNSGLPYSIFKLTMVLDILPRYANNGKPFIIGNQPHGWSWIYSGDVAKMVSKAFNTEDAKFKSFIVFGPDKLSIPEAVDHFNEEFYPEAKKAKGTPMWIMGIMGLIIGKKLRYAISLFKYFSTHPEEGDPTEANTLLGTPETGLKEFFEIQKGGAK